MSVRLIVKSANLGRGAPGPVARRNMARLKRRPLTRGGPQSVLWQELDDDDAAPERLILGDLFPPPRWHTWPGPHSPGCLVPITLPRPWRIADKHATKVSDGIAHITPDRYVTRVVATHPDLSDPLAFVSFQLVAGAFTNPGQAREDDRRRLWDEGWAGARGVIATLASDGITTVYGADTNNPRPPALHRLERRVVHRSLDILGYVPGSIDVRVKGSGRIPLGIDGHDGSWMALDLSNA